MKKSPYHILIQALFCTFMLAITINVMQKYNKLTVVEINSVFKSGKVRKLATCICDCGKTHITPMYSLKSGHTKSCGCQKIVSATTHGLSKHPLKRVYYAMLQRCHPDQVENPLYKNYAGRGISVCQEWKNSFLTFYNWCIGNGWKKGLEIDRRDNDGNYSPENCRIVDNKTNTNNRRRTLWVQYNGERRLVKEVCVQLGVNYRSILCRIEKGIQGDEIFNVHTNKKRFTDDDVRKMRVMREGGMSYNKIADILGTWKATVMYSLKERKLQS